MSIDPSLTLCKLNWFIRRCSIV